MFGRRRTTCPHGGRRFPFGLPGRGRLGIAPGVEEHIDMKCGGGRQYARTQSGRAASRRAGQRLIPAVILVRRQYQNGCNPFVPVRAAHTEGGGKAKAVRWSDCDGGADRASETVGGGGLATRKIR